MIIVRRFLVLAALMFWQGGFTFYSLVVIHVGHQVLGSQRQQAMVTRSVTNYLNLGGAVALAFWGWDVASTRDLSRVRRRWRWGLWSMLVLTLALLAWLHLPLDELMVPDSISDRSRFYGLHQWYLLTSTVQWAGSLLLTALTLLAWRCEDKESCLQHGG